MNNLANINNCQENKFSLESFNQAQYENLQKDADLSILSFDSQEELNYLQESEQNNQFLNEGDPFGYQSRYTFFEKRNSLLIDNAQNYNSNNNYTQRNFNYNQFDTNEMLYKKKKSNFQNKSQSQLNNHKNEEKKPSQQRKEQLLKRFESLSRIYNKELSQTATNGWLKSSQVKTINQDNSQAAKSNKMFYQQQKPFSAQITNSSLKYAAASNGFQNLDFQFKQKQQLIQQESKKKEQQNAESNNRLSTKPPKSANLNSYKNISNLKNFKEIILTRPNSKQVKFQQQNSVNSQPSSLVSQNLKMQSIEKNNLNNNNINDQNFYDDFVELGSTETTGFSFQNVFQLAGVSKDFIVSPRSPTTQDIKQTQEKKENELDQILNDHHIYVANSVINQNQIKNEQTERKTNLFGKTLTTLARPFSKEYPNRKDIIKSAQQNVRFNKNQDLLDSQNKVVAKNKKRTIFKINQNNQQVNQKDLQSNAASSIISQQNSIQQYGDDNFQQMSNEDQSPLIKQNSIDLNAAEIIQNDENENTQKENVLQQKKNVSNQIPSNQQQSNNYFKQEASTAGSSNASNFSTTSNRIISLQALRQKNNPTVKNSDNANQNQTNIQNQNNNLKENNEKQNKKTTKIQSGNSNQAGQIQNNQLQRTFFINSQDEYIRRTLIRMGWKENKLLLNSNFDLKWIYIDSNDDYKFLNDNQFYNHFKNNTELTQKGRLLYNLKNNTQFGVNQEQFFPRCYDLGNDQERGEFSNEFNRLNVMNLLKKHIQYIKLRRSQTYQEIKQAYQQKQANKLNAQVKDGIFFAKVTKQKFFSPLMYEDTKRDSRFIFNITVIAEAVEILKKLKRQQEEYIDETRQSRDCQLYIYQTNFKLESMISQYVKINVPFDEEKFVFEKIVGMSKEHWSSPSMKLMKKLYSLYKYFKDADPQFKVSGTKNIWIIKPSANSRGSGIYLVDKLDEAIDSGLKMQARIVQKYIERPLIFQGAKYKKLNNKKFDIRQWVLVTSFKPLKIYFFTSSYLRVCSQSFDLDNIKILSKHLTNFSLNKNNLAKENWDETVVELKDLITYLKEYKNIDYQEDVKPKIKDLVIETIKCAADKIVNRKKSFELYGFDILLDNYAHPWLLEVNLSPACSERSSFLTEMLDAMAYKMFQIVFKQNNLQEDLEIKETAPSAPPVSCQNPDYDWEEIYNEEQKEDFYEEDNQMQLAYNNDIQLMIIGQKADLKKEKNLDKKYFQYWGAIKIQARIRSFLAKRKLIKLKNQKLNQNNQNAIKIQSIIRQFLAKKQLNDLKQQKSNINTLIEQVSVSEV
ncbi:hypothetical protein ABPG74_007551 [Tetrahymena malaccensis]